MACGRGRNNRHTRRHIIDGSRPSFNLPIASSRHRITVFVASFAASHQDLSSHRPLPWPVSRLCHAQTLPIVAPHTSSAPLHGRHRAATAAATCVADNWGTDVDGNPTLSPPRLYSFPFSLIRIQRPPRRSKLLHYSNGFSRSVPSSMRERRLRPQPARGCSSFPGPRGPWRP